MLKAARHENLRLIATTLRRRAEAHGNTVPSHLRLQQRHLTRIASEVQVLLLNAGLQQELLDLAETVLRGLDQQLRAFENAAVAHTGRQARFLEHLEEN